MFRTPVPAHHRSRLRRPISTRRLTAAVFTLPLLTVIASATATRASAQTSLYATAGLAAYGFTNLDSSSDVHFKKTTGGFGAGIFYDFPIASRVTVGLDGRINGSPGTNGGIMGGGALRIGLVPHRVPLRPYVQLGAGVVHSGYNSVVLVASGPIETLLITRPSVTNGAAQLTFGLDIRLSEHYDLRAIDYGAQALGGSNVHAGVAYLQAGLVYHLHPRPRR